MNMNNIISRFLVESALYLELDPMQAFRALATEDPETESDTQADNDGVCRPFYKGLHPDLLPEGEGLPGSRASGLLPEGVGTLRHACPSCCA